MGILQKIASSISAKEVKLPVGSSQVVSQMRHSLPSNSRSAEQAMREYKNWVYACVNARAEELASITLQLKSDRTGEAVEKSEILDLLADVNPTTTRYELFFATQAYMDMAGNAFWYLARENDGKGKPRQIYLISPDRMSVVVDKENPLRVLGYSYKASASETITFDAREIIHFKNFNPRGGHPHPHLGYGIVEAAMWAIETDNEARNWNYSFFRNSAKPDGILTTDTSLTDEQYKRLKEDWKQTYGGSGNAGKTALMENGLKWQEISKSQKDMDFVAQRTFSRDEILALFRVPRTVIGITDNVNRANAEATDYVFARRTVKPLMRAFVSVLNEYLVSEMAPGHHFEFADPVPEDRAATVNEYSLGINKWLSRNDIRRRENLPESENGDTFYGQLADIAQDSVTETRTVAQSSVESKESAGNSKRKGDVIDDFIAKLRNSQPERKERRMKDGQKAILKELYLKRFDAAERAMAEDVSEYFISQEAEVMANLQEELKGLRPKEYALKDLGGDVIFDRKKAVAVAISLITPRIRQFLKEGAEVADTATGGDFDINDADTLNFITDRAKFFAEEINSTTAEDLLKSIKEGVDAGEGYNEIAQRVRAVYDAVQDYRVERIVRTEVSTALNMGSTEAYRQAGIKSLEWVAIIDDATSDECMSNDGKVREIGKAYPAGASMPPQHINCRCTTVAVFED